MELWEKGQGRLLYVGEGISPPRSEISIRIIQTPALTLLV